jgi:hypothetical protein
MSATRSLAARASEVVVGQPLPFPVFGGANTLLLAKGRIVENEAMRLSLLSQGFYYDGPSHAPAVDPLTVWRTEYLPTVQRYRFALQMSREETSESFPTWLIGAHEGVFVTTLPNSQDAPIAIEEGQSWVFRTFIGMDVVRFHAPIRKVSRRPFAHVCVGTPERVERRQVRVAPRAPVCLDATLGAGIGMSCVIADLSTTGARIAVRTGIELAKGDRMGLHTSVPLLGRTYAFSCNCIVTAKYEADPRHPGVAFYGVRFSGTSEIGELAVHGYVHQQLSTAVNTLEELLAEAQAPG